jgi:site-specific recombinase XerD
MTANDIDVYTAEVGEAFLANYFSNNNVCSQQRKRIKMLIHRLTDFSEGQTPPSRRTYFPKGEPLTGQNAVILDAFLEWRKSEGIKASTVDGNFVFCKSFLLHLKKLGCDSIVEVKPEHVCKACIMFKNKNAWSHVRVFLRYLHVNLVVPCDYSSLVPSYRRPVVLPSVYAEDDVHKLESIINRTSRNGARDYAIMLLVTRYGLRAGDIAKLTFKEIDFNRDCIRLTQEKTGKLWEAVMLPEVKAALLEYITNVRPAFDTDTVFLLGRAPFQGIKGSGLGTIIKRYLAKAGIDPGDRKQGTHAFRSSLASSMVNDNIPYEVVRRVLGHDDPNAIKHYARIDTEKLREYAIPVPEPSGVFLRFLCGEERVW